MCRDNPRIVPTTTHTALDLYHYMHHLLLLQVGKTKTPYIQEGILELTRQLKKFCRIEIKTIEEGKFLSPEMIEKERKDETLRIIKHIPEGIPVIYLDVLGKSFSSETFAQMLIDACGKGGKCIFIIGGAYGINEEVMKKIPLIRISLSSLTFTHQMVRLILLEQLYRAYSIIAGTSYHHS